MNSNILRRKNKQDLLMGLRGLRGKGANSSFTGLNLSNQNRSEVEETKRKRLWWDEEGGRNRDFG